MLILNCTPHPIDLTLSLFEGQRSPFGPSRSPDEYQSQEHVGHGAVACIRVYPCGARFAARQQYTGPRIGGTVDYVTDEDGHEADLKRLREICGCYQGNPALVIVSQISAHCLPARLDLGPVDLEVLVPVYFPVLADTAVTAAPANRWCDRLATAH